jgi:hypothetical protein
VAKRVGRGGTRLWDVLVLVSWLRQDRDARLAP